MSWGDILSAVAPLVTGSDKWGALVGAAGYGYDAYNSRNDAKDASRMYNQQLAQQQAQQQAMWQQGMAQNRAMMEWQMAQHAQDQMLGVVAASNANNMMTNQAGATTLERLAMRNRLLEQSSRLGAAMEQAYSYLGMPYMPSTQDIQRDYNDIRQLNHYNLDRLVENATSRTQADSMARGMDVSAQHRGAQRAHVREFAPRYQEADQAAFDAAIARATNQVNLHQGTRDNFLTEIGNVYGAQLNAESGMYNNQYTSPFSPAMPGLGGAPNMSGYASNSMNQPPVSPYLDHYEGLSGANQNAAGQYFDKFSKSVGQFASLFRNQGATANFPSSAMYDSSPFRYSQL